ncbi:LuxR C-terminal-related transcriptional regulator [Amycolatopsis sp. cg5]|uniref:helix-turn-helix transcriptional regulator n=1 Tax=Amycolatopsis sp. cg5 TaxID=3238802 RepID=UPI003524B29A
MWDVLNDRVIVEMRAQTGRFRVLLVDHHALRRKEVHRWLADMGALVQPVVMPVGDATGIDGPNDHGTVALVRSEHADGGAVDAVIRLRELGWPRVVVVGIGPDPFAVVDTLAAGARGYVAVASPGTFARKDRDPKVEDRMVTDSRGQIKLLSCREQGILQQVADGKTNKEIGTTLGLSPFTVKTHLARIGRKLHAGDRARMVLLALRSGVIH